MSRPPEIEKGYPLAWATGRPRTPERDRKSALWRSGGRPISLTEACKRLEEQVGSITRPGQSWRVTDQVLSSNIRYTASGARDRNVSRRDPDDRGVAFYFNLDGRPHVLACDRWDTVQDNIAAIAAHIGALRGQERWGVADLQQSFAGHVALPAPEQWWQILEVKPNATVSEIEASWRARIRAAHPDNAGGSTAAAARLNQARDEGKKANG